MRSWYSKSLTFKVDKFYPIIEICWFHRNPKNSTIVHIENSDHNTKEINLLLVYCEQSNKETIHLISYVQYFINTYTSNFLWKTGGLLSVTFQTSDDGIEFFFLVFIKLTNRFVCLIARAELKSKYKHSSRCQNN